MNDPILTPTPAEVLGCVRQTLENVIAPALKGGAEQSFAVTMTHLLSYVERRIDNEGQLLFDEIVRLKELLARARDWLPENDALAGRIADSLSVQRDPAVYPSLKLLAREVAVLRQHVCDLLLMLQAAEPDAGAEALHQAVRDYIVWQLEEEGARIFEPAFVGRGPRR